MSIIPTLYTVYWLDANTQPHCQQFTQLRPALAHAEQVRRSNKSTAVTMVGETAAQVGARGVAETSQAQHAAWLL